MPNPQSVLSLVAASGMLMATANSFAAVVYDNSTTDLNRSYSPGNGIEFGDEIFLSGTDRTITEFRFETFLSPTANGNETGQLVFHLNDGPPSNTPQRATPGTEIYRSDVFSLGAGRQTVIASGLSVSLPANVNRMTWSVVLNGVDSGEQAGLMLYSPPTVGSSYNDLWQNNGGTWTLLQIDGGATDATFAARIVAVPEPGTVTLGILGALSVFGFMNWRRRAS